MQKGASWMVAEGAERGKHSKSIPLEKAMDDVLVAYGQNGEAVRPEQGYPLRLLVPGCEGISNVKWLRRIKVVDQPYMSMMGKHHVRQSESRTAKRAGSSSRWDRNRSSPVLPADNGCPAADSTRSPAWLGPAGAPSAGSKYPPTAAGPGRTRSFRSRCIERRIPGFAFPGIGTEKRLCSSPAARMNGATFNRR